MTQLTVREFRTLATIAALHWAITHADEILAALRDFPERAAAARATTSYGTEMPGGDEAPGASSDQ